MSFKHAWVLNIFFFMFLRTGGILNEIQYFFIITDYL